MDAHDGHPFFMRKNFLTLFFQRIKILAPSAARFFDGRLQDTGLPHRRSLSKVLQAQAKGDDPILV